MTVRCGSLLQRGEFLYNGGKGMRLHFAHVI